MEVLERSTVREASHTKAPGKNAASTNPMKNLERRAPTKLWRAIEFKELPM